MIFGKLKSNFYPKVKPSVPTAKRNAAGKLITNSDQLKEVYLKNFVHRLRPRPIIPGLEQYKHEIESRFNDILKISNEVKFPDWNIRDLDKVLGTLKKGQSQDTMLFSNELFMLQNIGEDLKLSILLFCNKIKNNMTIPDFLQNIHVTAINKKKKCPLSLEGLRGIFLVPKLRAILVKLIYNLIIDEIECHLTNSNIVSRKNESPRDHLFVV